VRPLDLGEPRAVAITTHKHPTFPFIEVRLSDDGEGGIFVESTVDGATMQRGYSLSTMTPAAALDHALRAAETAFFTEEGGCHHLRRKTREAAARGDLLTLCALVEGAGYWRGYHTATQAHLAAIQQAEADAQPNTGAGFAANFLPDEP
jgi:hypothetical protein